MGGDALPLSSYPAWRLDHPAGRHLRGDRRRAASWRWNSRVVWPGDEHGRRARDERATAERLGAEAEDDGHRVCTTVGPRGGAG